MTELPAARRKPVGIALIGCGRISTPHVKAVQGQPEFGRLVAVVDSSLERAREVAAQYDVPYAFDDIAAVFDLDEVEAVILCTPNALHASQAALALAAGRHVLTEKPFSETVADAEQISALADRTGLVLAAGHTFRHVEAVRTLQDKRHDYGAVRAINISMCVRWDGPQAPWWATRTPEEGLILSLFAPHALDFLQLVMGDADPVRVHVEAARHQEGWLGEDEAMILLRYPGDVLASVHLSYNQKFMINRKSVHFDQAVLTVANGEELWLDDRQVVAATRQGPDGAPLLGDHITHYFATQFREFAMAVRGEPNRSVLHPDALRQTRLNRRIVDAAER